MVNVKMYAVLSIILLLSPLGFAKTLVNNTHDTHRLQVKLNGLNTSLGGVLYVYIYNDESQWLSPKESLTFKGFPVDTAKLNELFFFDLPKNETVAVQVHHDQNNNNAIDFQWFPPKPSEGVGVSNNTFRLGPPDYTDAQVIINEPLTSITITINY